MCLTVHTQLQKENPSRNVRRTSVLFSRLQKKKVTVFSHRGNREMGWCKIIYNYAPSRRKGGEGGSKRQTPLGTLHALWVGVSNPGVVN